MKDLFPGFYQGDEKKNSQTWQEGIFVFDTNMLLNVYRYTQKTRARYLEILDLLKERNQLWIPYQVAYEYHDRRLGVIQGQLDAYAEIDKTLQNISQKLENSLSAYSNKHEFIHAENLIKNINDVINSERKNIIQSKSKDKSEYEHLKKQDMLLEKLEEVFQGNIGSPYTGEKLRELYRQAQMRIELRIPPGWEDEDKKGYKRYGDIILWFQLIDYAQINKTPIIFVTDDGKKDWWIQSSQGKPIKPLPELIQEMFVEAGVLLLMYQGYNFLDTATQFFKLEDQPEIIEEAKEVTERNVVEAHQVKYSAPMPNYAPDVVEKSILNWLENSYPGSHLHVQFQDSIDRFPLDLLIIEPNSAKTIVNVKYFNNNNIKSVYNEVIGMINILENGQQFGKKVAFIVTGDRFYANEMVSILEERVAIPKNVTLIIGYFNMGEILIVGILPK